MKHLLTLILCIGCASESAPTDVTEDTYSDATLEVTDVSVEDVEKVFWPDQPNGAECRSPGHCASRCCYSLNYICTPDRYCTIGPPRDSGPPPVDAAEDAETCGISSINGCDPYANVVCADLAHPCVENRSGDNYTAITDWDEQGYILDCRGRRVGTIVDFRDESARDRWKIGGGNSVPVSSHPLSICNFIRNYGR